MVNQTSRPFFDGPDAVPYPMFAGRKDLRDVFTSLTWKRGKNRVDFVWVIEGRSSYGKSSFANWCREVVTSEAPDGNVVVCSTSLLE